LPLALKRLDCVSLDIFAKYEDGPIIPEGIAHTNLGPCWRKTYTFSGGNREHLLIRFAEGDDSPDELVLDGHAISAGQSDCQFVDVIPSLHWV
jgi:hypothetical protein